MTDNNDQITALQELRAYVVEARRAAIAGEGDKELRIKKIIEYQQALRALDEAIADEKKAPRSYGMLDAVDEPPKAAFGSYSSR